MKTLNHLFLNELEDMYDAERRILKALPKMAKAATCDELKEALQAHWKETQGHVKKLEQVFQCFGKKPKGKTCEGTVGLLKEGDEVAAEFHGSPALNAALVGAAQKVEHYEIASHGCLHEWEEELGNKKAAGLLRQCLDQEKHANEALNELAHASLNHEALGSSNANGSPDNSADERPANQARRVRPVGIGRSRAGSPKRPMP